MADIVAPQWEQYSVTITRVGPAILDDDNAIGAVKPARDEIAKWLGVDDGSPRITWQVRQRLELVRDETPGARSKHRTWLEVAVSPGAAVEAAPASAPARIEREKPAPPRPADEGQAPATSRALPARENGSHIRVAYMAGVHGEYLRLCLHYTQQGHAWRSAGLAVQLDEIDSLIEALGVVRAMGRGHGQARGVGGVFAGASSGAGADTPSDDVNKTVSHLSPHVSQPNNNPNYYSQSKSHPKPKPHPKPHPKPKTKASLQPRPQSQGLRPLTLREIDTDEVDDT